MSWKSRNITHAEVARLREHKITDATTLRVGEKYWYVYAGLAQVVSLTLTKLNLETGRYQKSEEKYYDDPDGVDSSNFLSDAGFAGYSFDDNGNDTGYVGENFVIPADAFTSEE